MVNLMKETFLKLGMPKTHVTDEMYFNHDQTPTRDELARAVEALKAPPVGMAHWSGAET